MTLTIYIYKKKASNKRGRESSRSSQVTVSCTPTSPNLFTLTARALRRMCQTSSLDATASPLAPFPAQPSQTLAHPFVQGSKISFQAWNACFAASKLTAEKTGSKSGDDGPQRARQGLSVTMMNRKDFLAVFWTQRTTGRKKDDRTTY